MDRIKDSGSFGRGSNPLGGTGQRHSTSERLFFYIIRARVYLRRGHLIYYQFIGFISLTPTGTRRPESAPATMK